MVTALAFARLAGLPDYYQLLDENFPECAENVITYFEEYYIGRLRTTGIRRTPMFPREMWTVRSCMLEGQTRTNNAQEGWHRRFPSALTCHHPSIAFGGSSPPALQTRSAAHHSVRNN
eukprot:scpid104327/ scgid19691/ 